MKFVNCPHCGMKNLEGVTECKSCRRPVEGGAEAFAPAVVSDKPAPAPKPPERPVVPTAGKAQPSKVAAASAEKVIPDAVASNTLNNKADSEGLTFENLVEEGLDAVDTASGDADSIEVVRDLGEVKSDDNIRATRSKSGVQIIDIADEKEETGIFGTNFRKRILPRLLLIGFVVVVSLLAIAGIVVYNIMDIPEYYNHFHMKIELTKNFSETLKQLRVYENARKNPKLGFQQDEIMGVFKNKYFKWTLIASKAERADLPRYKNVYLLTVRESTRSNEPHFVRMYMNDQMVKKIAKDGFKLDSDRQITISGRIIDWSRTGDKSILISAFDAAVE